MKSTSVLWKVLCVGLLSSLTGALLANEREEPTTKADVKIIATGTGNVPNQTEVVIEATTDDVGDEISRKDWPYLGIATQEASEALAAQLGLKNGAGLVVIFVGPDSPAAK